MNVASWEPRPIRVLLAHDCPLFAAGLRNVVEREEKMQLVGEATELGTLLPLVVATQPEVVLINGSLASCLPEANAAEVVAHLRIAGARGIIVFASSREEEELFSFLRSGAAAYVSPTITSTELLTTMRRVAGGEYLITSAALPEQIAGHAQRVPRVPLPKPPPADPSQITVREVAVLREVMRGQTNQQIGKVLKVSDQTVKNHMTSILRKLQVQDRTAAVVVALRRGLITLEEIDRQRVVPAPAVAYL